MFSLVPDLIEAWQADVAAAYRLGRLASREMVQAVLYQSLQGQGYPAREVWLSVPLQFQPGTGVAADQLERYQLQQWLSGRRPALLFTEDDAVVGVMELLFSPTEYGDFRQDMRRLIALYQLRGKAALFLAHDPDTGRLMTDRPYYLVDDLRCIYGVITRAGGLGLQVEALTREAPDPGFRASFLHLGGAVGPASATFFHTMDDFI